MDERKELVEFLKKAGEDELLTIEEDLGEGFYRLNIKEAEKRQAKHDIRSVEDALLELLRNSRDAKATHIFVASTKKGSDLREITVLDDGEGIPPSLWEKVFEPRVTSRLFDLIEDEFGIHGRGMALYAIKLHAKESRVMLSEPGKGCSIRIVFDLKEIPERKDQSVKPKLVREKGELRLKGGVKNIWRTLLEFSLSHPHLQIYHGSPAEIAATLRELSLKGALDGSFLSEAAIWSTGSEARERFAQWGIILSERNAYRVIGGEIDSLEPLTQSFFSLEKEKKVYLHIDQEDLEEIKEKTREIVEEIAGRYFLTVTQLNISQKGKKLHLTISLEDIEEIG